MASSVPNGEATRFSSGDVAARNGSKGGKAKAKNNKKKRLVMDIVNSILEKRVSKDEKAAELAQKYGIDDAKTIKDLYVAVCLYNSMASGSLAKLEQLMRMLGEDGGNDNGKGALDKLCEEIRAAARGSDEQ